MARTRELLAQATCRLHREDELLMSSHELQGVIKGARKELMAPAMLNYKAIWPKGGALDAYARWRSDQLARQALLDDED